MTAYELALKNALKTEARYFTVWYYRDWVEISLYKSFDVDPLRPTENRAFINLYNQSIYATLFRSI